MVIKVVGFRRQTADEEKQISIRIPQKIYQEALKHIDELVDDYNVSVYGSFNHYIICAIARINRYNRGCTTNRNDDE